MGRSYDAIVVLGGSLRKEHGQFLPSTYEDSDNFGMLGGHIRILAAVELLSQEASDRFVFSTGVTEKNKSRLGSNVSPEAGVYASSFVGILKERGLKKPEIVLEERSATTRTNIEEVLQLARSHGWKQIAIVTSEYHTPRVRAFCEYILSLQNIDLNVDILSAEDIIRRFLPGQYDDEISAAYGTKEAKRRAENESQGILDLWNGRYADRGFQP